MNKKEIEISRKQLTDIIGEDWPSFQKILNNCYCASCRDSYSSVIVKYRIFINDLNDAIFRGECKKCGSSLNRYTEIGEVPKYMKRIRAVLMKNNE